MANEQKMISISKIDEIMEERFPNYDTIDYYGEDLAIRRVIPFSSFSAIVRRVSEVCFDQDTGEFAPDKMDFAIRICIIEAYTNVRLPDETEHQYRILYWTDLVDVVMGHISMTQYNAMVSAIQDAVCVRNNANKVLFDNAVNEVLSKITDVGDSITEAFKAISPEDIQTLVSAIGANGIDEEKLAKAVVAEQNKARESAVSKDVIQFPSNGEMKDNKDGE